MGTEVEFVGRHKIEDISGGSNNWQRDRCFINCSGYFDRALTGDASSGKALEIKNKIHQKLKETFSHVRYYYRANPMDTDRSGSVKGSFQDFFCIDTNISVTYRADTSHRNKQQDKTILRFCQKYPLPYPACNDLSVAADTQNTCKAEIP